MSRSRQIQKRTRQRTILFLPFQTEAFCVYGEAILDVARNSGIYIDSECDGSGTCGKCRVWIIEGQGGPWTNSELDFLSGPDKKHGYRLACQVSVITDMTILVDCGQVSRGAAEEKAFGQTPVNVNPAVKCRKFKLSRPWEEVAALDDLDVLLATAIGQQRLIVSEWARRQLPSAVLASRKPFSALIWSDREVVQVTNDRKRLPLGAALDIGTAMSPSSASQYHRT